MRGSDLAQKQKSPCSTKTVPVPEFIACTQCGAEVELWTDEEVTLCPSCNYKVFKRESLRSLDRFLGSGIRHFGDNHGDSCRKNTRGVQG